MRASAFRSWSDSSRHDYSNTASMLAWRTGCVGSAVPSRSVPRWTDARALAVEEVDPTGAGDCFGATYVTCRALGESPEDSLRYANAAGVLAVGKSGPMEGTAGMVEIQQLCAQEFQTPSA